MKKLLRILAISISLALTPIASIAGGIPVIDVASIAEAIKTLIQLEKEFSELQEQTGLSTEQLRSLTGARGMADLVNDPTSRYYIPAKYQDILKLTAGIAGGDYDALQDRVAELLNAAKILDITDTGYVAGSKEYDAFVSDQNQIALNSALAEEAYDAANRRTENLQFLLEEINNAEDPKDIADLQARISAEQLMLTNEQNKLIALNQTQEAYWQRQNQRTKEERIKALGDGDLQTIDW